MSNLSLIGKCSSVDRLQVGKRRKHLEDAFDERTAELRILSECRAKMRQHPLTSQILLWEYSGAAKMALLCMPTELGKSAHALEVLLALNVTRYEMSGYPAGQPVVNWGDYILERHRRQIHEFWEQVFKSDEPMISAEWQWNNGRWSE